MEKSGTSKSEKRFLKALYGIFKGVITVGYVVYSFAKFLAIFILTITFASPTFNNPVIVILFQIGVFVSFGFMTARTINTNPLWHLERAYRQHKILKAEREIEKKKKVE